MARYRYAALDGEGAVVRGVEDASGREEAIERLRARGLALFKVEPDSRLAATLDALRADRRGPRGIGAERVAAVTRELAVLLAAGQTLDQALRFLAATARHAGSRRVLEGVRDRVRGGSPLAAALATEPGSFSRLYVGLVRAAEAGGTLAPTLAELASMLERERALAARLRSAMVYPATLVVGSILSVVLLLVYVLPQFTPIFAQAGATLPWSTRALIAAGDWLAAWGLVAVGAIVLLVILAAAALRQPEVRLAADRLILRLPVVGGIVREAEAARLTRTLGTLLAGGVGLVNAMVIARGVLANRAAIAAVEATTAGIREGVRLADRLEAARVFPPRTIQLLRLGEETGRLAEVALKAADAHEETVRRTLDQLVALLVPVTTVVMGLVVAAIIGSLLSAMLSLNDLAS